ncbi:MAG: DUF4369 domain-containing protein [Bacteroidaceae bacterium]|nr:DUF4369 domain-containing protein [Bacteroidaceae bacterium]
MEKSSKYGVWVMLVVLLTAFSACSSTYQITGNSDITTLDGKILSLRTLQDGHWVEVDSAEVVHGLFSMNGKADTTRMVTIYFDNQGIMPIILENGDISVSISNQTMRAEGTPLNDALYDFIRVRNSMERQLGILNSREARLIMEGANPDFIHMQIQQEIDSINRQMNAFARSFISDNFNNILGPSVFMMMCSTLPYPILTDEIEAILNSAPESFLNQEWVKDFISKAKENQQLIEENRRLMHNLEEERILQQHQQQITNSGGH